MICRRNAGLALKRASLDDVPLCNSLERSYLLDPASSRRSSEPDQRIHKGLLLKHKASKARFQEGEGYPEGYR